MLHLLRRVLVFISYVSFIKALLGKHEIYKKKKEKERELKMPSLIPFSYTFSHTIYSGLFYLIELQLIFINSEVIVTEAESIAAHAELQLNAFYPTENMK